MWSLPPGASGGPGGAAAQAYSSPAGLPSRACGGGLEGALALPLAPGGGAGRGGEDGGGGGLGGGGGGAFLAAMEASRPASAAGTVARTRIQVGPRP